MSNKPSHPYSDLPATGFWRTGVAEKHALQIRGLWQPKFRVRKKHKIATAGSCFAQHIGNALAARGYHWHNAEPAPEGLNKEAARHFNYGVFSARTGNIYTAGMLLQWLELAYEQREPIMEVWEKDDRFYDPLRPAIEPDGFASEEELHASRTATLAAIRRSVEQSQIFVFTLGLTESWQNLEAGFEYAICPGTVAGDFDATKHAFKNHDVNGVLSDMRAAIRLMRKHNKKLKMLLTVSPVPLTATASGQHVLSATSYSKSLLRTVAGQLAARYDMVDYFPSYEIITNPVFRGMFYEPNMRSVAPEGVAHVMQNFFDDQTAAFGNKGVGKPVTKAKVTNMKPAIKAKAAKTSDVKCEEEMLGAFAK